MPKAKKESSSSDSDSGPEDRNPPNKKSKVGPTESTESTSTTTGADAEWKLDKMRFVSVLDFKGRQMINIREYYEKDGKVLPGKKGIALSREQWKKLCGYVDEINKKLD